MKGVVFLGDKECEVREFPDPVPNDGEVTSKNDGKRHLR